MKLLKKSALIFVFFLSACGGVFLDFKPDQRQRVPASIADYQALLDNTSLTTNPMNIRSSHTLGVIGGDEFYLTPAQLDGFPTGLRFNYQRNAYLWKPMVYEGGEGGTTNPIDFETGYMRILRCNVVLDGLGTIEPGPSDMADWENVYGTALFHRAFNYYNLAQLYCPVYRRETANSDIGIPLRLESDPTQQVPRATVAEIYAQILSDLTESVNMLPDEPHVLFRPSRAAAYALLARVCLQMEDYVTAEMYATLCLNLKNGLINFNDLELEENLRFPIDGDGNPEVIFFTTIYNAPILGRSYLNVDSNLISSYKEGDLRKTMYFIQINDGQIQFKGSYSGDDLFFSGLATDEVFLIRSECQARQGHLAEALTDLNHVRIHRYSTDKFTPLNGSDRLQILHWIIEERKKELVFRGTRWEDLRRFNKEPEFSTTLVRETNNGRTELLPNDPKYVWPLPVEASSFY